MWWCHFFEPFWSLTADCWAGSCGGEPYPLPIGFGGLPGRLNALAFGLGVWLPFPFLNTQKKMVSRQAERVSLGVGNSRTALAAVHALAVWAGVLSMPLRIGALVVAPARR